jgi:hypothetical protein
MRFHTAKTFAVSILLTLTFASASALAQEPAAKKPAKKTNVAAAQKKKKDEPVALPPPPPPQPEPAAAAEAPPPAILVDVPPPPVVLTKISKDKDKNEAKPEADDDDPPNAGPGFVGGVRFSGEGLIGEAATNYLVGAAFTTIVGSAGYYFTDHFGAFAGLKFGFGAAFECGADCTTASTWQVPLTVQYAFDDRTRGAYLEGGLGLFSGVHMNVKGANDAHIEFTTPVEGKFGAGYRWKSRQGKVTQATSLHMGVDLGQYSALSINAGGREILGGDIASDRKALHVAFSVGVGFQF